MCNYFTESAGCWISFTKVKRIPQSSVLCCLKISPTLLAPSQLKLEPCILCHYTLSIIKSFFKPLHLCVFIARMNNKNIIWNNEAKTKYEIQLNISCVMHDDKNVLKVKDRKLFKQQQKTGGFFFYMFVKIHVFLILIVLGLSLVLHCSFIP